MKKHAPDYRVITTMDYAAFRPSDDNRDHSKFKALTNSMARYGWRPSKPMMVAKRNGQMYVVDGQHRFDVAQELNIPVRYVVEPDDDLDISVINNAQKPWSTRDYVTSFIKKGNSEYQFLLRFCDIHRLPLGVCAKILLGSHGKDGGAKIIKTGKFIVKNADQGEIVASIVASVRKHARWAANAMFVDAISKAIKVKGFSIDQFISRCDSCPGLLQNQPTTDAFLLLIERIYNHRSVVKNRLAIHFEATKAHNGDEMT